MLKIFFTLFRMGGRGGDGGDKSPPVTYANFRIRPQNFLTFSFNPIATLV